MCILLNTASLQILTTNTILLLVSGISTEVKLSSRVRGVAGSNSDKVKSLLFDKNLTYSSLNGGGLQIMTISDEQFILESNQTTTHNLNTLITLIISYSTVETLPI